MYVLETRAGAFAEHGVATRARFELVAKSDAACVPVLADPALGRSSTRAEDRWGVEMRLSVGAFDGTDRARVECALRLARRAFESVEFQQAVRARATFHDHGSPAGVERDLSGEAVAAMMVEASGRAPATRVLRAGAWARFKAHFFGSHAFTNLNSGPVYLVPSWVESSSVEALSATIVHEWLHVLGFCDPDKSATSVVYGTESFTEARAAVVLEAARRWAPRRPPASAAGP